jgi:hypothetical protein
MTGGGAAISLGLTGSGHVKIRRGAWNEELFRPLEGSEFEPSVPRRMTKVSKRFISAPRQRNCGSACAASATLHVRDGGLLSLGTDMGSILRSAPEYCTG